MTLRDDHIRAVNALSGWVKDLFEALKSASPKAERLSNAHSFYVAKGGADGGLNDRVVEIFFGQRPVDSFYIHTALVENYNKDNSS